MRVAGMLNDEDGAHKLMFAAKVFVVGQRARALARLMRNVNENKTDDKKKGK